VQHSQVPDFKGEKKFLTRFSRFAKIANPPEVSGAVPSINGTIRRYLQMATKLKDSLAVLDNLFQGKPLPQKLAVRKQAAEEAEMRLERKRLDDQITDSLERAPLVAICHKHACQRCGNKWESFGHFARRVKQPVMGYGTATVTRKVDYVPFGEVPGETQWIDLEEVACISCYGAAPKIVGSGH
jgi:hypothetical protein